MRSQDIQWLLREKYHGKKTEGFFADLERLEEGEPLPYVIGHVPFLGCQTYLDSRPLIPRQETEFWVEKAISVIKSAKSITPQILDLCAGSGCIGVAVAKALPGARVTFAELEGSHIPTIIKNLARNLPHYSIRRESWPVVESDLFEKVSGKFDFILTNPPYIDPAVDRAAESVKRYEPHLALYGGKNGIDIIRDIISEARGYLNEGGQLWIEHEPEQAELINELAKQADYAAASHHHDQYDVFRYSILVR